MALEVVLTQTLPGGHTLVYLRNTDAETPPIQLADRPDELVKRIEEADADLVDTAQLVAINHALHAHRHKIVLEIAAKEAHHATLAASLEQSTLSAKTKR